MPKPLKLRVKQYKFDQVPDISEPKTKCYAVAIKLLAIREHSRSELKRKLEKKGWQINLIEAVLDELKEQNLQSDLRYAEILLNSRLGKGYGPLFVQHYLRDKGVDAMAIESVLDFNNVAWQKALNKTAVKKFGADKTDDFKQKIKQMNFLKMRGFTSDQIRNYYDSDTLIE